MKLHCRVPAFDAALLVCLTLLFTTNSFAQASSLALKPNNPSQLDMQSREWALTHIPEEVNKHFKKDQLSLFAQIREDFTRIQVIDNEMMQRVFVDKVFDLELVDAAISEINKRASRLREYLVLPRPDVETKRDKRELAGNEPSIKAELVALDRAINSFVNNSVFKQPQVLDTKGAVQAGEDLAQIINLSKSLRSCSRRNDAPGK